MALGRILKLLMGGFQQASPESANALELEESTEATETEPPEIPLDETPSNEAFSATVAHEPTTPTDESTVTELPTISKGKNMINISMLQQELQNFVTGAPDVQGAALVSPDGLALASVLPGGMDEERTAAMSASIAIAW